MAFPAWCAIESHPIVQQIARKYNLTTRDARNVFNTARSSDITIQGDDVTLDFVESSEGFKKAMSAYTTEYVSADKSLLNRVLGDGKISDESELLEEQILDVLGDDATQEEMEELMQRYQELDAKIKRNKESASDILSVLHGFRDGRRLDYIGDWLCHRMTYMMNYIEFDSAFRAENGIPTKAERREYFFDPDAINAVRDDLYSQLEAAQEYCENDELASELQTVIDYLPTVLFMYGGNLFRTEGVSFSPQATVVAKEADEEEDDDEDSSEDSETNNIEERSIGNFSVSDQNKSVTTKLQAPVKVLLSGVFETDRNGDFKTDPFGYGLCRFVSVPAATNKILQVCMGCETLSEMLNAMNESVASFPWLDQVIRALDTSDTMDSSGEIEITQSRKERLQSQFYQSFRKQFTRFRHSYMKIDEEGFMYFEDVDSNVSTQSENMLRTIRGNFITHGGMDILTEGAVDFGKIAQLSKKLENPVGKISKSYDSVEAKLQSARSSASDIAQKGLIEGAVQDFSQTDYILKTAEAQIQEILEAFGFENLDEMLPAFLYSGDPEKAMQSEFGSNRAFGREDIALRIENLNSLFTETRALIREFMAWDEAMKAGTTSDTPFTNPFSTRGMFGSDYADARKLRRRYMNLIEMLSSSYPDAVESFAHMAGKDYYSWNNPSSIQTVVEKLKKGSLEDVQRYMDEKYGQDKLWFVREARDQEDANLPHFYSSWLEQLYHSNGKDLIEYSEKPMFCGTEYDKLSDVAYIMSILNDFFATKGLDGNLAWYRMLIASDKPRYSSVRFKKYTTVSLNDAGKFSETDYRSIIARQAVDFFAQELIRCNEVIHHMLEDDTKIDNYDPKRTEAVEKVLQKIKNKEKITRRDVLDSEGRYIFRNSGVSFFLNKFLNAEIEKKDSKLGTYVINKVFNTSTPTAVIEQEIMKPFKDAFHQYMEDILDNFWKHLDHAGVLTIAMKKDQNGTNLYAKYVLGSLLNWHSGEEKFSDLMYGREAEMYEEAKRAGIDLTTDEGKQLESFCYQLAQFRRDLRMFVYNNWMAKANMSEMFDVDLAFYKDTPNFQKRNAQVISSGYVTDPEAKIHGERVSDGFYRSITLKTDKKNRSSHLENIRVALENAAATITDPARKRQFLASMEDTLGKLKEVDATDGQGLVCLTSLRKRLAGQGEWSVSATSEIDDRPETMTDEAVYRRWVRGTTTTDDLLHVFAQAQKPFVYADVNERRKGPRENITYPVQHKNSEYALCFLSAFTGSKPQSQMEAIAKFMEETARIGEEGDYKYSPRGIDTVNFDSGVKIGNNSKTIDITGLSPQETYEKLKQAVYGDSPATDETGHPVYLEGVVTKYEDTAYKIQQTKPEHFKHNAQPMGSQLKILAINNIDDASQIKMPDGKTISGKELKTRYFAALRKKMRGAEKDFEKSLGLDFSHRQRVHYLSGALKSAMATDSKFSVEMRHALSVVERGGEEQFAIPLDDPGTQAAIEAMLYSKIRKAYYKEKTNGGIVVQATSWGSSADLGIRFQSKNPEDKEGLLPKKKDFGKARNLSGEQLDQAYLEYCRQYQGDYAYMEIEAPMPDYVRKMLLDSDGKVDPKYMNPDGSWNMDEIRKTVPASAFDAICYRVPTEAKYSVMVCKIVRFSPEASGSIARYPEEITVFTGSDFDIDTDTIELRPIPGSKSEREDEELFNLQMAALRSNQGLLESFRSGDFSDLSELSYYISLLSSGEYTTEQLDAMNPRELKDRCSRLEDLDLMDPSTDMALRKQNADAGDMIAIAAVGVTSHAFLSLYNDVDQSNQQRDPAVHPENFLRIKFNIGKEGKRRNEAFIVINDKTENVTRRHIGGEYASMMDYAILDAAYDMDGKLIGTEISKYVGGSADAAKDAALARLNITRDTLPILILMHRLGVSSDVARLFLRQPVIMDVVQKLNNESAFGYSSIEDACNSVLAEMQQNYKGDPEDFKRQLQEAQYDLNLTLKYSELVDNIAHPDNQTLYSKLQQIWLMFTLAEKSKFIRNLDSFTRYNSSAAMRGSSFLDRYASRQKVGRLQKNLMSEHPMLLLPQDVQIEQGFMPNEYGRLCSMFPYIAHIVNGEDRLVENIILENMKSYNPAFFQMASRLGIEDDAEAMKALYAGWKNYLLFVGGSRIADFWDKRTMEHYTKDFVDEVYNPTVEGIKQHDPEFFESILKNNSFFKSIRPTMSKDKYAQFIVLSTNVVRLSGQAAEQYKKDWALLLDYPQTRQLAIDLGIYFLSRTSRFDRDTPVHLMPNAVKEAIPNYIEAFADAGKVSMTEADINRFLKTFARNNSGNTKIVPHFGRSTNQVAYFDEKEGELIFPKDYIDRIKGDKILVTEQDMRFKCPVIQITSTDYPDGQLFVVEEPLQLRSEEIAEFYAIPAKEVKPLGIPNQFLEYAGFEEDESIFAAEDSAPTADNQDENLPFHPGDSVGDLVMGPNAELNYGRRTGTYIESQPYGSTEGDYERYLSRHVSDRSNISEGQVKLSPYLESRTFLRRATRLANQFGFSLDSSHRGYDGSSVAYSIGISPAKFGMQQHEEAEKVAALMSAFSIEAGGRTTAKTYVNNMSESFTDVEFTIRLTDEALSKDRLARIRSYAKQLGLPFEIDVEAKELRFMSNVDIYETDEDRLAAMHEHTDLMVRTRNAMAEHGLAIYDEVEANFVNRTVFDENNLEQALTAIRDEAIENERQEREKAPKTPGNDSRNQGRKPIRVSDLAVLALKRARGEKVNAELQRVFNERALPLKNVSSSYTSSTFVDSVVKALPDGVNDTMRRILDSTRISQLTTPELTDRLIINVANWILGQRSRDDLMTMMDEIGLPAKQSVSIIDTIDQILKDLDIC